MEISECIDKLEKVLLEQDEVKISIGAGWHGTAATPVLLSVFRNWVLDVARAWIVVGDVKILIQSGANTEEGITLEENSLEVDERRQRCLT